MVGQILRFTIIGTLAAAVHLGMVALLAGLGIHPLVANIFGFASAFSVSYLGHRFVTFPERRLRHLTSVHRFWWVALAGFALNEGLYALLLAVTKLHYLASLFLVLLIVTPITFTLGRLWAFR